MTEAYRVLRDGGRALLIGPVRPANRAVRALAETWMLFPSTAEYRAWFERAGFADVELVPLAPAWYRSRRGPYAVAVSGRKPAPGRSPAAVGEPAERLGAPLGRRERVRRLGRFALGSLAGAAFLPLAACLGRAGAAAGAREPMSVGSRTGAPPADPAAGPVGAGSARSVARAAGGAVGLHPPPHDHRHHAERARALRHRGRGAARAGPRRRARQPRLDAARRWCVNVYIVGINQLEDVEIDRINKPFLPIAAGELSVPAARRIVAACAVVPVVLGVTQGPVELGGVLAGLAVGTAYSVPPLRLKRFPLLAALSITGVRALVVNLAVALHFSSSLAGTWTVPGPVWALCLFVVPFAFAISILKDVPDAEGDRRHRIAPSPCGSGRGG